MMTKQRRSSKDGTAAQARCERFLAARSCLDEFYSSLQHVPRTQRRLGSLPRGFAKRYGCIEDEEEIRQLEEERKHHDLGGQQGRVEQKKRAKRERKERHEGKERSIVAREEKSSIDTRQHSIHVNWDLFPAATIGQGNETVDENMEHYLEGLGELAPNRRRQSIITEMFQPSPKQFSGDDVDAGIVLSMNHIRQRKKRSFASKTA